MSKPANYRGMSNIKLLFHQTIHAQRDDSDDNHLFMQLHIF